jgi:methyl-accepting chemotaxis protein
MDDKGRPGGQGKRSKGDLMASQADNEAKDKGEKKSFRRRQYLVDRKRQLAATVRVAGLVLVLLIVLNAVLAWQNFNVTASVMATNPDAGERMRAADMRNMAITAGISLIILAMVVMRSIMLTHRTAGAVYKISMCLEQVGDFNFDVNLRLRNDDNLRALEDPFNKMAGNLRRRAIDDYQAMKKLADEIEEHGSPVDAEMLRRIADSTARMAK